MDGGYYERWWGKGGFPDDPKGEEGPTNPTDDRGCHVPQKAALPGRLVRLDAQERRGHRDNLDGAHRAHGYAKQVMVSKPETATSHESP
jgi:hypothetical protein